MSPLSRYGQALESLRSFVEEPIRTPRDVAGVLQAYAFTFELAWKAVQADISARGYTQRGPKPSLQAAVLTGLIDQHSIEEWSSMIGDRNLVAHTYRADWARALAERISGHHLPMLERLYEALSRSPYSVGDEADA